MEEPSPKPSETTPSESKPPEKPPSPNLKAIEDLSWEIPGGQTVLNFFVREGKAVKNGWLAISIMIGLTVWITRSCTKERMNEQVSELRGQLQDAKQDRDTARTMLAPFQAAALKIYTNEPMQERLDLLASELDGLSKEANIRLSVNSLTNLFESPRVGVPFTISNFVVISNRTIELKILNLSPYPAIKSVVDFAAEADPTNFQVNGWVGQPSDARHKAHFRYDADHSIPMEMSWGIASIQVSSNFNQPTFTADFIIAADNAKTRRYNIVFIVPP